MEKKFPLSKIDKSYFSVVSKFEHDLDDEYWKKQDYATRLKAIEIMRGINFGYDPSAARLQRVLEIAELKTN